MRCLAIVVLLSGCFVSDHRCALSNSGADLAPSYQLLDPATLQCEPYGESCDPACGPCPAQAAIGMPTWAVCDATTPCREIRDEATCGTMSGCRIARDWAAYYENTPSFLGCYPLDMVVAASTTCAGLGAQDCSRHDDCTGLYDTATDTTPTHEFKECIREGQLAGVCGGAACDLAGPSCSSGTTPGIANGCFTGSCIPDQFCTR